MLPECYYLAELVLAHDSFAEGLEDGLDEQLEDRDLFLRRHVGYLQFESDQTIEL